MSSMIIWMLGIGASVALLVISAAMKLHYLHMVVAAIVAILVALSAFRDARQEASNQAGLALVASANLRHMGMIWAWGAVTIFATYAFRILTWREWMTFFVALMVLSGLSLFLSATLRKDGEAGTKDDTMLKVARGYAIFMLAAMVITMIGLIVDGKLWRFATVAGQRPNSQDWAANNIFFFGALAMAAVAWNTIQNLKATKS